MGWHLGGMSYEEYLDLTWTERAALHLELRDMIERTAPGPDEGGEPPRRQRK